jgi:ankyrin repeat protein
MNGMRLTWVLMLVAATPAAAANPDAAEFMKAAGNGNLALVQELIDNDASLASTKDGTGRTALHKAGTKKVAEALIAAKADLNATAGFGQTPLWEAASDGREGVVEALLAAGAKTDVAASDGSTALHRAATFNEGGIAQRLIAAHAGLAVKDDRGRTPLATAAARCKKVVVQLLVNAGSDLNARDGEGHTPTDLAMQCRASEGKEAILSVLREAKTAP